MTRIAGRRPVFLLISVLVFVLRTRNDAPNPNGAGFFAGAPLALPPGAPPDSPKKKNVIAYSLYGNQEQFWGGAVPNADLAAELFPGWEVRYYHDDSVPTKVLDELKTMSNVRLYDMARDPVGPNPRAWRFHVALDPEVDGAYILRDTDSRLSKREKAAVDEWLASNYTFHYMHDHPHHCFYQMQGGMWGGRGIIPEMDCVIKRCAFEDKSVHKYDDQVLLREYLLPAVEKDVMHHDSFCCGRFDREEYVESRPFPTRRERNGDHVGSQWVPGRNGPMSKAPLEDDCPRKSKQ